MITEGICSRCSSPQVGLRKRSNLPSPFLKMIPHLAVILQRIWFSLSHPSLALTNKYYHERTPHAHTASTRFFPRSHPQNDPREDSASCFSFALIRIRAASRSFCTDAHSALVRLGDRGGVVRSSNNLYLLFPHLHSQKDLGEEAEAFTL